MFRLVRASEHGWLSSQDNYFDKSDRWPPLYNHNEFVDAKTINKKRSKTTNSETFRFVDRLPDGKNHQTREQNNNNNNKKNMMLI